MLSIIHNMPEATYHADPCKTPSLSASLAHVIDSQSLAHAWALHPKLGGKRSKPTGAMNDGSVLHAMILGVGSVAVVVVDAKDFRTKAAKEARAGAGDKPVVLRAHYDHLQETAAKISQAIARCGIDLTQGKTESSVFWESDGVQCRARMDFTDIRSGADIVDLKSCDTANPERLARKCIDYGYDLQSAAYIEALETVHPHLAGRIRYRLIFFEASLPDKVVPIRFSGEFEAIGRGKWERAKRLWQHALETDQWPGYPATTLELPRWEFEREVGRQATEEVQHG